jgi:branched-chain amino acid transport system substrate-binding protein
MRTGRVKLIGTLVICFVFIFWCGEASLCKEPIKIGSLSALTGVGSQMGQCQRDSVIMVIDKVNSTGGINGEKIKYYIEDDQLQPTVAVNGAKKLVYNDGVQVVLGTPNSPTALAAMEVTWAAKVPQLMFGTAPKVTQLGNPWIFRVCPMDSVLGMHLVNFAVNVKKVQKIALMHDSTDYGKGGLASVLEALKKFNLKPVITETFNNEDVDFSSQINNIKSSGAQGFILYSLHVQGAQILNQSKKLGLSIPIFGSSGMLQGNFLSLAQDSAEGAFFVSYFSLDNPNPRVQAFIKEYKERYKYDPTPCSAVSYEGTNLVIAAIKKVGTDRTKIRDVLRSTKDYMGVSGRLTADETGEMGRGAIIVEIKGGKPVTIWASN